MAPKKAAPPPKGSPAASEGPAPRPVIFLEFASSQPKRTEDGEGEHPIEVPKPALTPAPVCRLEFELFTDVVPKTCENFKSLCLGAVVGDKKAKESKTCSYKGTRALRLTADMVQFGDVLNREDGKGQESIYGPAFEDEHFNAVPHERGTLSMVNSGPNTNGSQFFICLRDAPFLNPLHVSFGKLIGGEMAMKHLATLVEALESVDADPAGRFPANCPVTISSCGLSDSVPPSRTARSTA